MVSKFFKKIFFVFTFLTISFSINLFFQTESEAVGCEKNAGRIVISELGRDGDQVYDTNVKAPFNYADNYTDTEFNTKNTNACQQEPDEYLVKFYNFYICREDPYKGNASPDFTSCLSIFSNAAGKNITIKPNEAEKLLEGNIQIEAGTYPYAAVVISNQLSIKHKQEYIIILDNSTEETPNLNGKGDSGTATGNMWCYSVPIATSYSGDENIQDKVLKKMQEKRVSDVAFFDDRWIYKEIQPFVDIANVKANWNFDWDWSEHIQFAKYGLNQHYGWHCDSAPTPYKNVPDGMKGKIRKLSVTVCLSDPEDYDGGELEFDLRNSQDYEHDKSSKTICSEIKQKGSIVVFPSFLWHRVKPVTKGTRYSLVMWNLGKPWR